jgi:hypothetical protein
VAAVQRAESARAIRLCRRGVAVAVLVLLAVLVLPPLLLAGAPLTGPRPRVRLDRSIRLTGAG